MQHSYKTRLINRTLAEKLAFAIHKRLTGYYYYTGVRVESTKEPGSQVLHRVFVYTDSMMDKTKKELDQFVDGFLAANLPESMQ